MPSLSNIGNEKLEGAAFSICPMHKLIKLIYNGLGMYGDAYNGEKLTDPITCPDWKSSTSGGS